MPIPKLVITAALMVAQVALGAMRKIEGPRLDSRKVTLAEYNTPLPRFWGLYRHVGCPNFWSADLREKKKKSKTKGGKYAEYKYFWDGAVAIADQQIDGVRRIWFDNHLVYDLSGVGPVSVGSFVSDLVTQASGQVLKLGQGKNLRFYLGTDTQMPDPRMEAWYEDHPDFGPNSCPAHRGLAYAMFQDIPVEKFGNRPPTVDIEAVSSKTPDYPYEEFPTNYTLPNAQFSPDFTTIYAVSGGNFEVWDVPTRSLIAEVPTSGGGFAAAPGGFYALNSFFGQSLIFVSNGGAESIVTPNADLPTTMDEVYWAGGAVFTLPAAGNDAYLMGRSAIGAPFEVTTMFTALDGDPIAMGLNGTDIHIFNINTNQNFTVTTTGTGDVYGVTNMNGDFVIVHTTGEVLLVDPVTETVTDTAAWTFSGDIVSQMRAQTVGVASIWLDLSEFSTLDLSLIRTVDQDDWLGWGTLQGTLYDPISHALILKPLFSAQWVWIYLDRISSVGVLLQHIVEDVGGWCGVTIDAAALNQVVPGHSVIPASGKEMISPVLDLHHSILRPNDFTIKGIKHSATSLGTILTAEFVREGDEKRYATDETQDNTLPLELTVSFLDKSKDHQPNNVIAMRSSVAVDSERQQSIDMQTYVEDATNMQQMSDRFLRWVWNSRWSLKNAVTAQYLALEPGDVYTKELDGELWDCELQKITLSALNPRIDCEWRRTFPALVHLGSQLGSGQTGAYNDAIIIPGPAKGFVLDIPLLVDADNMPNPSLYYALGGYGVGTFPGGAIYTSDDPVMDFLEWNAVTSSDRAVWGSTTDVLADVPSPWLWDRGNTFNVRVFGGTLSNATEDEIDADPRINMAALKSGEDWELFNFTDATLTGSTSTYNEYTISGFKRGVRGTEWATGGHAVGDDFVLVSSLDPDVIGLSEVGDQFYFKAQTYGRDPDGAAVITFPFEGQSLMPYAPARINWTTDGTDMFGEIIRRTRVGGSWTDNGAVPLSENSEAYEVEILDGGGNVLRTIVVTGTNLFTYLGADIATDGGSVGVIPSYNAYQLSDAVGRGFALAA